MRVLTLTNLYPNVFQPSRATFNRQQLRAMADRHDVRVIAPIAWTDEFRARKAGKGPLPAGRQVEHDGLTVDHPRYYFPPKVGRRWYGKFFEMSVAKTFDRAVEEFRPEVVFAPWAYPDGWAAIRLARRYGLPVVVKCHGSDILSIDRHPSRRGPTAEAVRSADGVVAVSRHLGERLLELGVERERIRVIIDGVDKATFHPGCKKEARSAVGLSEGPPVLLFVGNLVHVKAVDALLSACGLLRDHGFAFRLVVIGEGPLRSELERQTASLELQSCVAFKGVQPHQNLPEWFRAADLFVLPSRSEGVPTVLLEASASDTPWVASAVGGIPEIAELGRSRLLRPDSPTELAEAIRQSIVQPAPRPIKTPRSREESVDELTEFLAESLANAASSRHRKVVFVS